MNAAAGDMRHVCASCAAGISGGSAAGRSRTPQTTAERIWIQRGAARGAVEYAGADHAEEKAGAGVIAEADKALSLPAGDGAARVQLCGSLRAGGVAAQKAEYKRRRAVGRGVKRARHRAPQRASGKAVELKRDEQIGADEKRKQRRQQHAAAHMQRVDDGRGRELREQQQRKHGACQRQRAQHVGKVGFQFHTGHLAQFYAQFYARRKDFIRAA